MNEYAELLQRLQSMIGEDVSEENIFKQASEAIQDLLVQSQGYLKDRLLEEPSDHEAEGAMRYVMSRGR